MTNFNYKQLSQADLDVIFDGIQFKLNPRWHQAVSIAFAIDRDIGRVFYEHGVGTGKTLCALFTTQVWGCHKTLVVGPSSVFSAWNRDIPRGTDYSYVFLTGTKDERIAKLEEDYDIYIINYEGLKTIYGMLVHGYGWQIDDSLFDVYRFDNLIIDEVHHCNNYKSIQSLICQKISSKAEYCIGMTGTSVDKSLLEVFNTYRVVDLGVSLGTNFFYYRNKYFYPSGYNWKTKKGAKVEILEKLKKTTISFDRSECLDLPPLEPIEVEVESSEEYLELRDKILNNEPIYIDGRDIFSIEDKEDNNFDSQKAHRLRQLSLGFLYYKDEDENQCVYRLKNNPKIDTLIEIIGDSNSKFIIFYWYIEEKTMIIEALKKAKIKYLVMSNQKPEIKISLEKRFNKESDIQVLVDQSRGAEGYQAFAADVVLFLLPLGSPRMREQAIGRIHREGQTKSCLAIDLVLKRSFDKRIIKDRGERFDLVDSYKKYLQEYKGD